MLISLTAEQGLDTHDTLRWLLIHKPWEPHWYRFMRRGVKQVIIGLAGYGGPEKHNLSVFGQFT